MDCLFKAFQWFEQVFKHHRGYCYQMPCNAQLSTLHFTNCNSKPEQRFRSFSWAQASLGARWTLLIFQAFIKFYSFTMFHLNTCLMKGEVRMRLAMLKLSANWARNWEFWRLSMLLSRSFTCPAAEFDVRCSALRCSKSLSRYITRSHGLAPSSNGLLWVEKDMTEMVPYQVWGGFTEA